MEMETDLTGRESFVLEARRKLMDELVAWQPCRGSNESCHGEKNISEVIVRTPNISVDKLFLSRGPQSYFHSLSVENFLS